MFWVGFSYRFGDIMAMEDYEIQRAYDEMLDDAYGIIKIGYSEFYASDILKSCDPIAYRIGLSEYEDYLAEEEDSDEEE
jgi:hypothetical protein